MKYLIAIPVFNEIKYVEHVLNKVKQFHSEVVFIDDGSSDGTAEWLAARNDVRVVRHDRNRGYGQSIIDSFEYGHREGFDWVITMDCDEQHEPEMIPHFVRAIETDRWDIISGSRYSESRSNDDVAPGDRRMINMTITATLNELFDFRLTDSFCGFKAHRVSTMLPLKLDETGYAFPLQLWPRAAVAGLRITEIPVRLIYNDPNRYFGGGLDDAKRRLAHYREVLENEVRRAGVELVAASASVESAPSPLPVSDSPADDCEASKCCCNG